MNDSSESEKEEYNQISEIIEEKRKSIPSTKTASVISITSSSITQKHPPKSMVSTSHSSTDKLQSKVSELDLKQQVKLDIKQMSTRNL
jgi:hypothetical protein